MGEFCDDVSSREAPCSAGNPQRQVLSYAVIIGKMEDEHRRVLGVESGVSVFPSDSGWGPCPRILYEKSLELSLADQSNSITP